MAVWYDSSLTLALIWCSPCWLIQIIQGRRKLWPLDRHVVTGRSLHPLRCSSFCCFVTVFLPKMFKIWSGGKNLFKRTSLNWLDSHFLFSFTKHQHIYSSQTKVKNPFGEWIECMGELFYCARCNPFIYTDLTFQHKHTLMISRPCGRLDKHINQLQTRGYTQLLSIENKLHINTTMSRLNVCFR